MLKTKSFLLAAGLVLALAFTFSCTSDIESAEEVLARASSSSDGSSSSVVSLSSAGSSSSATQGISSGGSSQSVSVFCDFGNGSCQLFSAEACLVFGQVVESCPGIAASSSSSAPPSSGSLVPSSSSSSLSETVLCDFSGTCSPISADFCALLGGTPVQSCPESSSSAPPSSSSVPPSSSSVEPSSSSALPSSSSLEPSSSSPVPSSSSVVPSSSSYGGLCAGFVEGTEREHYGKMKKQFCDERDVNKYVYVVIGTQTWMAENLNYAPNSGTFISCDTYNCATYGRLYDWSTAMTVCPSGWHLPSQAEWDAMTTYIGGASTEGKKLKATGFGGTDDYGFSALPGGYAPSVGIFGNVGRSGFWWSTSEYNSYDAYYQGLDYYNEDASWIYGTKADLFSVRCLKN